MVVVTADRETLIAVADLLAPLAKQVDAVALRTTPVNRRAVTRYLREVVEISERCVEEMIRADRAAPAPEADVMWA